MPWGEVHEVIGPVRLVLAGKDDKVSGDDLRSRLGMCFRVLDGTH